MIVRNLEEVKNTLLHDAIKIATLQGNKFNKLYIDKEGGCSIRFSNKMSILNIKLFVANLNPNKYLNKSLNEIEVEYFKDYEFTDDNKSIIYALDSFNYNVNKTLTI